MKMKCFLSVLLLIGSPVWAGAIDLSCTLPTQNEDGSALTDLAGVRFYESLTTGGPYTLIGDEVVCALAIDRAAGTYYFVATAYNTANVESQYSNEATKTLAASPPAPPGNLVVEASNLVAYALSQTADVVIAYPVGTVPEGTACDSTMRFNDKYVVPRATVTWAGTVEPRVVFAACGAG